MVSISPVSSGLSCDNKVWQTLPFKAGWGFGSLWFLTSSRVLLWGWDVHLWVDVLEG
jgi:hypothetical protein